MSSTMRWETVPLHDPELYGIAGTRDDGRECLWIVSTDGSCELSDSDCDALESDDAGWDDPPIELIREALELASAGTENNHGHI